MMPLNITNEPGIMATKPTPPKERKKHDRFNGMSEEEVSKRTLPDHLANNLDIIIVSVILTSCSFLFINNFTKSIFSMDDDRHCESSHSIENGFLFSHDKCNEISENILINADFCAYRFRFTYRSESIQDYSRRIEAITMPDQAIIFGSACTCPVWHMSKWTQRKTLSCWIMELDSQIWCREPQRAQLIWREKKSRRAVEYCMKSCEDIGQKSPYSTEN